jgi:hypothetical protein
VRSAGVGRRSLGPLSVGSTLSADGHERGPWARR